MDDSRFTNRFNLYDIFSNFLPGSVLLIGIFLPLVGPTGILVELRLGSALVLTVLAFAGGLAVQVLGSELRSGATEFRRYLETVVNDDSENRTGRERVADDSDDCEDTPSDNETEIEDERPTVEERLRTEEDGSLDREKQRSEHEDESQEVELIDDLQVIEVDVQFLEACRREFGFDAEFDDWEQLYRVILSKLKSVPQSRAIRLQALYLGMRGMVVTLSILAVYYLVFGIGVHHDQLMAELELWTIFLLFAICAVLVPLFYSRQKEFRSDVTRYMIIEYYLEQ